MNNFSLSTNAINYSWQQIALRVGAEFSMIQDQPCMNGVPLFYDHPAAISATGKKIIVVPCKLEAWDELLSKESNTIHWASPADVFPKNHVKSETPLPILFRANANVNDQFAEFSEDGTLIFYIDIVATTFFMLSRWEETQSVAQEDAHSRFSAFTSVAYRQNFLDLPIVDLYALAFGEWLSLIMPEPAFNASKFTVNLTHDIDWVQRFSSFSHFLRLTAVEFVKRRSVLGVLRQIRNLYTRIVRPTDDDFFKSIDQLAEFSETYGFKSRFYFMAAERSQFQQGYNPAVMFLKKCMADLQDRGHEIGIHPGYSSFSRVQKLIDEKGTLERAAGKSILGGRQHFLRFRAPGTWRDWEQAGLKYDSTLGYADYEGFRCGTSYPYRPFDVEKDEIINIIEIPLIVMDTTLKAYRKLSPLQAKSKILELAKKCMEVGGCFTLLWHNTSLVDEWSEWRPIYQEALAELAEMEKAQPPVVL